MNRRVRLNARLGLGALDVELQTARRLACHETAPPWGTKRDAKRHSVPRAAKLAQTTELAREPQSAKPWLTEATAASDHCRADPKG
jgi:hypothetical protein